MLCLNEEQISQAASLDDFMGAVEAAMLLYEKKDFNMPLRMHTGYQGNSLLLMPCFSGDRSAVKLVSIYPANTLKNLPVLMGTVILNDGSTGKLLAVMNGTKLTALRTGAVGGTAIRCLTPAGIRKLGLVGAGVQGFHQALFACQARSITCISVYDQQSAVLPSFIHRLAAALPAVEIRQATSSEDLLQESDVIITATNSEEPVLPDNKDLLQGKYFVGIGSYRPAMREFPAALFQLLDEIYVDTEHALEESGDLIDPLTNHWLERHQVKTLGSRISRELQAKGEPTTTPALGVKGDKAVLFKSVGMALFDLTAADLVYRKAMAMGLGTQVDW